jgi:glutamate carboxypeptidase
MTFIRKEDFVKDLPQTLGLLEELVNLESPSTDKAAVDRLGERIVQEFREIGGAIEVFQDETAGNCVLARWGSGAGGILMMCHMDTVFEVGTTLQRPFRQDGEKAYGPGVLDMKGGIAILASVLRSYQRENVWPEWPITVLLTGDEETGSTASRRLIEEQAAKAALVLCMEPALASGALKTARKGTGAISITTRGVATHAGADHERGRNAIEELAHHVLAAQKLTDYSHGTTVNVGVIQGGTRTNVVPDSARAEADFRVYDLEEIKRLEAWAQDLKPVIDGAGVSAEVSVNRPPMTRDALMRQTFAKAQAIAREIGIELGEGSTGGGSDANFVAPLGVAVLDGLGAIGEGAHSEREHILIRSLPERAALLAALLSNW